MNTDELKSANKGEWSELYVLFKIFSDREIAAANSDLMPITAKSYHFLNIIREETKGVALTYDLTQPRVVRILNAAGALLKEIETDDLNKKVIDTFDQINKSQATFQMDALKSLMDEFLIRKIKANSSEKTDILASFTDRSNVMDEPMGFSIKSYIGGPPTLINPSNHTNFIYEIKGFAGNIDQINSIDNKKTKVRDRVKAILNAGGRFEFINISSETFLANLRFTDTNYSNILAQMLVEFYSGNSNSISEAAIKVASSIDSAANLDEIIYKTKGFLRSAALGMVPSKIWDTKLSAYGGYIIVKSDGTLLCYSLQKDDDFKDYLFNSTRFDTPSTTRYGFAKLYEVDGRLFFNLNLQIRFKNI